MKSRRLSCMTAIMMLAVPAVPVSSVAQERPDNQQQKRGHHRYRLIDIGTFGGPASFVNPAVNGGPTISRNGTTVGSSATSTPTSSHSNPFVCFGLDGTLPFVFHAFQLQEGALTDLGAFPPAVDNCSNAQAVNGSMEITGQSENGLIDPLTGTKEVRAVLWKDGQMRELGTLGGNDSLANQINSRGQITGAALNGILDPFSIYYFQFFNSSNGTQTRAFLWEKGQMKDLGTLGGPDAAGIFVNEHGQVAGASYLNSTPNATTGVPTEDPFLWTKDKGMIDLGRLGGTFGFPIALNNRGQVVGQSNIAGDQVADPFLWDGEKLIDLYTSTLGGSPLTAEALNDAGEVAGVATFPNRPFDAYVWRNGLATDLGAVGNDGCSWAHAMNARGQIVGQSFACDGSTVRSFLWENGSMVDLNALVPPGSTLQLVDTQAINDRGEIAGLGVPPGCTQDTQCGHAFVLIPCDDQHSGEEGCEDVEIAAPTIQNSPAFINQTTTTPQQSSATASEIPTRN